MILGCGPDLEPRSRAKSWCSRRRPAKATSRKPRSRRPRRATGGYSTNMPPTTRRGSAWRPAPRRTGRGPSLPDPFGIREDSWDNWHLSTGPITQIDGQRPGDVLQRRHARRALADRLDQLRSRFHARHRAGPRAAARAAAGQPIAPRQTSPLPPRPSSRATRIALYYSLEDRILRRALIRRYTR